MGDVLNYGYDCKFSPLCTLFCTLQSEICFQHKVLSHFYYYGLRCCREYSGRECLTDIYVSDIYEKCRQMNEDEAETRLIVFEFY